MRSAETHRRVAAVFAGIGAGILAGMLLFVLASCTPHKPPQPPTPPTPPPAEDTYPQMLLRQDGPLLKTVEGTPVQILGCILCCPDEAPAGWPGINRAGIDECLQATRGKSSYYEYRVGCYMSRSEPQFKDIGGCYAEVDGKADLNTWNPKFWAHLEDAVRYAGSKGGYVLVDLIDDWSKRNRADGNCENGYPHPWVTGCNIQSEDGFGNMPRELNARHKALITKIIATVGKYGNVLWQDGNEVGLDGSPGYDVEWTNSMRRYVTEQERAQGVPEHLFMTNAYPHDAAYNSMADMIAIHTNGESWPAPINERPTWVNEYNPNPVMSPEAMQSMWCAAVAARTIYVPWRHGMAIHDWIRALGLVADAAENGCAGVPTGGCPGNPPETRSISCKEHSSGTGAGGPWHLFDCTPKKPSGGDLWPEGNGAVRLACETVSMCGEARSEACISFRLENVVGDLRIVSTAHNGFGFVTGGSGSADIKCTIPQADAHFAGCGMLGGGRMEVRP